MPVDLSMVGLRGLAQAQETLNDIAARGLVAEQTRAAQIENDQAEREAEIQNEAVRSLQSIARGDKSANNDSLFDDSDFDSQASPLEAIGQFMIKAGAPKRGMEYLKTGVDIRKKEDEMLTAQETREKTRLDNIISTGDIVSKTIGVAKNESEWRYGLAQLRRMPDVVNNLGEEAMKALEDMDYDADVVAYLNEQAMSAKDRADLALKVQGEQRQQRSAAELAQYRNTLTDLNRAKFEEQVRARKVKEKEGGTKADTGPSASQVKSAEAAVANVIFNGKLPDTDSEEYVAFKSGAQSIASRAVSMVRANKGISWNEAVQRATMESNAAGDWETMKVLVKHKFAGITYSESTEERGKRFKDKGSNPLDAIELPSDKKKLKTGAYYITSRGVAKWNGSAFEKAPNNDE